MTTVASLRLGPFHPGQLDGHPRAPQGDLIEKLQRTVILVDRPRGQLLLFDQVIKKRANLFRPQRLGRPTIIRHKASYTSQLRLWGLGAEAVDFHDHLHLVL